MSSSEAAKLARWIDEIVEDPAVTLRRAEERLVAKLHLESVKLYVPALEARLAADREKYLHPDEKDKMEKLSEAAQKAEQKYGAAFAAEAMLEAQQLLRSDKAGAAKTKLEAAAKRLGQGLSPIRRSSRFIRRSSTDAVKRSQSGWSVERILFPRA